MSKNCRAKDPSNCRYHGTGVYAGTDTPINNFFNNKPIPAGKFVPNYMEIRELNELRRKYHRAVNNGDFPVITQTRAELAQLAVSATNTRFIPKMVMEGKCGIDGCGFSTIGGMAPDHYAGVSCKSGGYNHCTCDSCF